MDHSLEISPELTLKSFVEDVYFPFYQRKWKTSTAMTNKDRIQREIVKGLSDRFFALAAKRRRWSSVNRMR
jgi:hypothetical protein